MHLPQPQPVPDEQHQIDTMPLPARPVRPALVTAALAALMALPCSLPLAQAQTSAPASAPASAKAALSVEVVSPVSAQVPVTLQANGNIAAWQEASIGAEIAGLRLVEVRVDVGDRVRKGQLLAVFNSETIRADLAQLEAALAQARAAQADAVDNAERTRALRDTGALSAQQIQQALSAETAAQAGVAAAQAAVQAQQLRLAQTRVVAPDDGVISARTATVGAIGGAGVDLFKLIRGGRIEWRAEVPAAELVRLKAGDKAQLTTPAGRSVTGKVRKIAPTVDAQSRNGLVLVDLPVGPEGDLKPGMFARGEFSFDSRPSLTLPASAVLLRDGRAVVMQVGADQKVRQTVVRVLARLDQRVAVEGLDASARVVRQGGAFLSDGDTVRIVTAPTLPTKAAAVAAPKS
ncbi:efflux RND transporter periplasmic adaptor subunit [Sphaerotilus mobilis]|uniref:RND family efflux transporter MFP subunit n=1 Tax=Sphaerotilus mobilis TaxID=47994 RepID=A0A4Q7L8N2_9BURK|nr:efflux RND transporter periplasmic adaptor subunit [Sphaerotilus mobilis]RZS46788.1 RND family efflux transporter MFP subunit [Sphaerotilus mobilis]